MAPRTDHCTVIKAPNLHVAMLRGQPELTIGPTPHETYNYMMTCKLYVQARKGDCLRIGSQAKCKSTHL